MTPLVYRSAYLRTLDTIGTDDWGSPQTRFYRVDRRSPRIGAAWFPDLRTRGISVRSEPFGRWPDSHWTYPWGALTDGWFVQSLRGVVVGD